MLAEPSQAQQLSCIDLYQVSRLKGPQSQWLWQGTPVIDLSVNKHALRQWLMCVFKLE